MKKFFSGAKRFGFSESTIAMLVVAIAVMFITLGGFGVFYFIEWQRTALLKKLKIPTEVFKKLDVKQQSNLQNILMADEKLLCTLHPYVGKNVLQKELNNFQISSLEKFELPSEDMTWYLLFFSDSKLTRAYLVEGYSQMFIKADAPKCASANGSYFVETKRTPSGDSKELTLILNRR